MPKKDYALIAATCRKHLDTYRLPGGFSLSKWDALRDLASELAEVLAEDNPRFDRARFLAACGIFA